MKRRRFLLGAGAAAGGGASLLGTGAFSSVTAQRQIEVSIVDDSGAYLRLAPCQAGGDNGAYVDNVSSTAIAIDLTGSNPNNPPSGNGVTSQARTKFYNVFEVCNQGTQDVCVDFRIGAEGVDDVPKIPSDADVPGNFDFDPGDDAVIFYKGSDDSARIEGLDTLDSGSASAFHLNVGDCQCIGFSVRAFGFDTPKTLFSDVDLLIRADANANCASSGGGGGGPTIPTNGLVSHWPLDSIEDGTAEDIVGNNDGTPKPQSNGPTSTTGQVDEAAQFDGNDDYVEIPDDSSLGVTNVTVSAWVYRNSSKNFVYVFDGRDHNYALKFDDNSNKVTFGTTTASGGQIITSPSAIPDQTWTHVAGTYDGSKMKLYIDGTEEVTGSSQSGDLKTSTGPARIGNYIGGGYEFVGRIDDVRVYDRALSASEVQDLYDATK